MHESPAAWWISSDRRRRGCCATTRGGCSASSASRLVDADRVARATIPGVRRDDARRSRALVGWVLARVARDGHTQRPRGEVADRLTEFGVGDPQAAITAALAAGLVHESPDGQLGLTRYVEAEDGDRARPLRGSWPPPSRSRCRATRRSAPRRAPAASRSTAALRAGSPSSPAARAPARAAPCATLVDPRRGRGQVGGPGRADRSRRQAARGAVRRPRVARCTGCSARNRASPSDGVRFDGGFARGADWPLDEDVVVVDEASMLDVELADALLTACKDGTHLLFVGDAAQLPSIGPGRVLGDLDRLRRRARSPSCARCTGRPRAARSPGSRRRCAAGELPAGRRPDP